MFLNTEILITTMYNRFWNSKRKKYLKDNIDLHLMHIGGGLLYSAFEGNKSFFISTSSLYFVVISDSLIESKYKPLNNLMKYIMINDSVK